MDAAVFDFIQGVLLLEQPPKLNKAGRHQRRFFVGRFQQVTSPVMAKGLEDTAFYRYYPLTSANEVGGEPARAAISIEQFHEENQWRRSEHALSMTCTSTHDTKRSEDVRARISVLSEIPNRWRSAVNRWTRLNRRFHHEVHGEPAPCRNDEYLFYQTLAGVWPLEPPNEPEHQQLVDRLAAYMEKATHEAKMHTSWISPDPGYDKAVDQFVRNVLRNEPKNRFLAEFRQFHEAVVGWGLYTALAQVFLKLTTPGVPDTYQGQEVWDFSLVDPDNRRPVNYGVRRWLLGELQGRVSSGDEGLLSIARELAASPRDSRLKLFVTWRTLQFRRQHAELFRTGRYLPLDVEGSRAEHVCAFAWHLPTTTDRPEQVALVIAPRLLARLTMSSEQSPPSPAPIGADVWDDTRIVAPELIQQPLTNLFTGQTCTFDHHRLRLATAMSDFPVALLTNTDE
jgi:(1->4)-alpha-D-glucan 1-alpha-D-glucosylmutase